MPFVLSSVPSRMPPALILRVSPAPANWCGGASANQKNFSAHRCFLHLHFGGRIYFTLQRRAKEVSSPVTRRNVRPLAHEFFMTPIVIRFGGYQKPASIHNRAAARFGEILKATLGDRVSFELIGDVLATRPRLGRSVADGRARRVDLLLHLDRALYRLGSRIQAAGIAFHGQGRPPVIAALNGGLGAYLQAGACAKQRLIACSASGTTAFGIFPIACGRSARRPIAADCASEPR